MKEIYDLAEQYHNYGNNCVESVVKACNDGLKLGLPDVAIRMVSGMGGGIGRSGCVCGGHLRVGRVWLGFKGLEA